MKIVRAEWQDIADKAIEYGESAILNEVLPQVLQDDANALFAATNLFLANIKNSYMKIMLYNMVKKKEHEIRALTKKLDINAANKLRAEIAEYKNLLVTDEEFSFFISQIGKYQKSLNNYLGKEIETIYLYQAPNGNIEIYRLVGDISQAVYKDIASRGAGLTARFSASAINNSSVFEKLKSHSATESSSEGHLTATYAEVLHRGQISKQYISGNGMLILWRPQATWKKMKVAGGAGDLGEAYMSFLMSENRVKYFHGSMEPDIDTFMLQGVAQVDNISGLLKGDFMANDKDYAAKANGASMMGYRQIINLALEIQAAKNPEKIKQIMIREYGKVQKKEASGSGRRNKLAEALSTSEEQLLAQHILNKSGVKEI